MRAGSHETPAPSFRVEEEAPAMSRIFRGDVLMRWIVDVDSVPIRQLLVTCVATRS